MPRPRSESARQAVLEAMRAALSSSGYEAVTIEGLAEAAGVSKQTIYRWWPSKAAILGEALLEGELPILTTPFSDDFAADLRAWFSVDDGGETGALARALIAITATDPELGAALNERLAAPIREWVTARLALAVSAGDVRADASPDIIADHIVAIGTYAALLGRPIDVDATVDVLLRGISV